MLTSGPVRPSYSADWGDYISFAERLQEKAEDDGSDLIVVDTGDRVEGNGLYDAAHPKGKYILNIFGRQRVDLLCIGNHELYKNHSSYDEHEITVPNSQGNYLASNVDIIDRDSGDRRPLAPRFKKFTTKNQGIRVLAFGFLYDFDLNSSNTFVEKVEETIKEQWFQDAIRDKEVDLFLVIGHVPVRTSEFKLIFRSIRKENWDVPIQFLGGHLHIRDYIKYDEKAYGLASGRFMETIGFMSISGLETSYRSSSIFDHSNHRAKSQSSGAIATMGTPKFARRYIDNNLYSFHHHTGLNKTSFPTARGLNVSQLIAKDRKELGLDKAYGCAPQDYWASRVPYPSQSSIFTWLQDHVLPDQVRDEDRADVPRLIITNTGAIRFDLFKGRFTLDSMYTISPFTSGFRYIKDVPFDIARRILTLLNQGGPILLTDSQSLAYRTPVAAGKVKERGEVHKRQSIAQKPLDDSLSQDNLIPGYTTTDDAGSDGDDTKHSPIRSYRIPNCIESRVSFPESFRETANPDTVDLVYNEFIQRYILLALKFLGTDYSEADTSAYMDGKSLTQAIGTWVKNNWSCEDE